MVKLREFFFFFIMDAEEFVGKLRLNKSSNASAIIEYILVI